MTTTRSRPSLFGITWVTCPVVPFNTVAGRCARCGTALTGRRSRWCSKECELVYQQNHYWNAARAACLRRDMRRCVRCGWVETPGQLPLMLPNLPLSPLTVPTLEVNHKIPRNGQGYGTGCHHHLSNLETLCHEHHVKVTRRQRIARSRYKSRKHDKLTSALAEDIS